ncbi:MAG: bactofilin family protein [Anaerolineae bacterium]
MLKKWGVVLLLVGILSLAATPVWAAQGGGGLHFGPYSLADGDVVTGDLVVFGPVIIGEDAVFEGDLAAFGKVTVKENAVIAGDLVSFGAAEVAGVVEGSVFVAGALHLVETALVEGDVAAVGGISQEEGASIRGEMSSVDEPPFDWNVPSIGPFVFAQDSPSSMWYRVFWILIRALGTIVVVTLFALLIAAVWPTQLERVGQVIVDEPLPTFGVGALTLLVALVAMMVLTLTLCLIPFAFLIGVVVGVALVLGWVALGALLGRRLLRGVFRARHVTPLGSAVLGTGLITLLAVMLHLISGCLSTLLVFPLLALVAGAVTLTRFGALPYASRGVVSRPSPPMPGVVPPSVPEPEEEPQVPDELK